MTKMLRITRTVTVTMDTPLSSYHHYDEDAVTGSRPMSVDDAIAYEESLDGEDAWDAATTMVALAEEKDIKLSCQVEIIDDESQS